MSIFNRLIKKNRRNAIDNFNRVFSRQIRKTLGDNPIIPPEYEVLFDKVSTTYNDFEKHKIFLSNTADISIKELRSTNENFQKSKDELSTTKTELEESKKLAAMSHELQTANSSLKSKEEEIRSAYNELKDTQNQLILSEKMASLGQLTAGVAHEINTPLSVINGSITNLNDSLQDIMKDMPEFFGQLKEEHKDTFLRLVQMSSQNTKTESISTKEEREIRKKLTEVLTEKEIANARGVARNLVRVGLHDNVDEFIPLFGEEGADDTIDMVLRIGKLQSNVNNMAIAVSKMQKIVFSLKNYSHFQGTDEAVDSDIIDGIETVITLYHNKMKEGVEIIRNYAEEKLPIKCFPDQLDQVWTNLIHNAVQAMNFKGILTIDAKYEGSNLVVAIKDNGPGIPDDVKSRIFDPFFTTKAQGEGSGLGLSICKKIIDKHNGTIDIQTDKEGTIFTITLPKESKFDTNS